MGQREVHSLKTSWSLNLRLSSACFLVLEVETETEDGEETPAKTQALRSHTADFTSKRSPYLLPVQCIICKHDKYKYETFSRKRVKEKLIQCATLTAGKLLLAAQGRKDESLLLHIRDRDLVASEARYHFTCYRDYTRYLFKNKNEKTESSLYENGYKYFCETVIEEKLKNVKCSDCQTWICFSKDIVQEREGLNIATYKAHSLNIVLRSL